MTVLVFPNSTGGLTPFRPLSGLQEIPVATREESGVHSFPSRRGLTPRVSLRSPAEGEGHEGFPPPPENLFLSHSCPHTLHVSSLQPRCVGTGLQEEA